MNKEKTIERLKELKTEHELPNDNEGLYNIGYVKAMNNAINLVQNLNIGSVVFSEERAKCVHPRHEREYIGANSIRCKLCGHTMR